ncbi:MAG: type II toxin-antitoxin system PemK/MazF family toxin [Nanoarchaeota archaeon]|nr:type II toxin-antitoxin system PemK/MazF family toxin [Nanoarchaeota archaeon]
MEGFVKYEKGDVVIFQFPFSDVNDSKKRPSLVVATLKGDHVILAQITGQPHPDPDLTDLKAKDFQSGGISRDSFIRPSILFTIHKSKINYIAGKLKKEKIKEVQDKLYEIFTR